MRFTQIPTDTFNELQLNAGVLLSSFVPEQAAVPSMNHVIIGATSGGVQFTATPSYVDMGEDVDNAPKNTKELKKLETWDIKMTGTFVTVNDDVIGRVAGAGDMDITTADMRKLVPRNDLKSADFKDLWWVGDYGSKGGFIAIHMMNTLSTGGFQLQSTDKEKGQFAFEFTAHYSAENIDQVPFEIYICDELKAS